MPHGDIETFHQDDQWHNRIEGELGLLGSYRTKAAAVDAGRDVARAHKVEHIIKNMHGRIGERNTYGHDPRDIPG